MDTGSTEQLQPADARDSLSLEQQKPEASVSSDVGFGQNEQQEAADPSLSRRQPEASENHSIDSYGFLNVVDRQGRLGELCRPDLHFLQSLLDAQRDKIHEQLQELQKVVVLQCRITGTNPLAQEMAAVVLGKRVGKKFGDTLTPKALKCLHNVFSIKDTITKKEAREISALCGATVTQVREFFAGQRSRVRKVVHFSHIDQRNDDSILRSPSIQMDQPSLLGSHFAENALLPCTQQGPGNQGNHLALLETFCGKPDGISSKLYAVEKAEHLINVMHKESTFTGQSQLAQVIMQAHDSVLRCFMARGGLQQIIRWLMQAAVEEQTSLIRLILKAITQLPLGSALPRHMSSLLQTVNKLRFYRAQDVASRARLLLSRWSRFCKSTQSSKSGSSTGTARSCHPGQKRNRDSAHPSTVEDASKKKAKAGSIAVDAGQMSDVVSSSLTEDKSVQERQKPETVPDIINARKRLGIFSIQGDRTKEKRKVQLFEETRAATRRRDEVTKSSSFEPPSRPLSADDIKKAKIRAQFLKNAKAEKPSSSKVDGSMTLDLSTVSFEGQKRLSGNCGHRVGRQEFLSREASSGANPSAMDVKASSHPTKAAQNLQIPCHEPAEAQMPTGSESSSVGFMMGVEQIESGADENAMDMIPSICWTLPPRLALDPRWKLATGEQSTENMTEDKRLSTVLEATYPSPHCIPSNPAEPAERLCLFVDDTLVPELFLEAVDEESLERDCSLQSPRDVEPAEVHIGEADSEKLDAICDIKIHKHVSCSSMIDISDESHGLEMALKVAELSRGKDDEQLSLGSLASQLDVSKAIGKVNSTPDALKTGGVFPSEHTLTISVDEACVEARKIEFPNAEAYQQTCNTPFVQLRNLEATPIFKDQTPVASSATVKASTSQAVVVKENHLSLAQSDGLRVTTLSAPDTETPTSLDRIGRPTSHNSTSGVDLSELSKEACMDMLNVVLQQLAADNAKGSGADLQLLSVFLKNPQLVYSLMSSQSESLGKGLPMSFTGSNLNEIISSSTMGSLGNQLEELVGRNINQVASSVKELASTGCYTSDTRQLASRPSILIEGPQTHPSFSSSIPRPFAAIDPTMQLPNSQSKALGSGSQEFFKHPSIQESSSSRNSDYDWSQPYDYPPGCMRQGTGLARHSAHSAIPTDISISKSVYSTPTEYPQAYLTRGSQVSNSILQTDQRVQPSMSMHVGGLGPSMMHTERKDERATNRRNGFCVMDVPTTQLVPKSLARTGGISDGLLPVPDMAANSHRVHPCKVIPESHSVYGGTVPPLSPAVARHQAPHHLDNGHFYSDQNFKPQSVSSSHPPYLSHGRGPAPITRDHFRGQGSPNLWRPPTSHSSRPRQARPGWKEG